MIRPLAGLAGAMLLIAGFAAAGSAEPPTVVVRGGEHDGFGRLVFDWPSATAYRADIVEGELVVSFPEAARFDLSPLSRDLEDYLEAGRAGDDGRSVRIPLKAPFGLKHFTLGPKVVVDLVDPPGGAGAGPPPPPPRAPGSAELRAKPEAQPEGADRKPAGGPPAPAEAATPEAPPRPDAAPGQPVQLLPEALARSAEAAEAAPAPAGPDEKEAAAPTPGKPRPPSSRPEQAIEADVDLISANAAPTAPADMPRTGRAVASGRPVALRFNWAEPVGAAAFLHGGRLWLVFERAVKGDIGGMITKAAPMLAPVDQLPHDKAAVIRLAMPAGFSARLETEGNDWIVYLRRHEGDPPRALAAEIDRAGEQARVRVPLPASGEVVPVTDPDLGTPLWVVPIRSPRLGMARQYSLPELRLLATFQGVVVEPQADGVTVALDQQGVVVAGGEGLSVSATALRNAREGDPAGGPAGRRLLDLASWRGSGPFLARKQRLQQAVVAADSGEADLARLDLARFYFAHGLASETLGLLELIGRQSKRLVADPQLLLLKGASELLGNKIEAAAETLSHPALEGEWDARLWRGALAALADDWPAAARLLSETEPLIDGYPLSVRKRLWLLAAEARLQVADGAAAQGYLDLVRGAGPNLLERARADYLEGERLMLDGDVDKALALWRAVADREGAAAARARLALVEHGLEEGTLSAADAIAELERLRFAWRGDRFEFALLQRLGELYLGQGRFRDALLAMRHAASHLPEAARNKALIQRMREVFAALFLGDQGKSVPPIAALGIYREFKELTPAGPEGDALIARLAERLVEVDLLVQAAELLQSQVDHRLSGLEKARTGSRVAALHLLNRQPERALEALDKSEITEIPEELSAERRLLQARALVELGRSDEALALLRDDRSEPALRLRAEVYWTERRWPEAASALEAYLPDEPPGDRKLAAEQVQLILSLAVAYTLSNDRDSLAELDRRYGAAMSGTEDGEAFAMLTAELRHGAITSIADELAGVEAIQAFLTDYRERLGPPDRGSLN